MHWNSNWWWCRMRTQDQQRYCNSSWGEHTCGYWSSRQSIQLLVRFFSLREKCQPHVGAWKAKKTPNDITIPAAVLLAWLKYCTESLHLQQQFSVISTFIQPAVLLCKILPSHNNIICCLVKATSWTNTSRGTRWNPKNYFHLTSQPDGIQVLYKELFMEEKLLSQQSSAYCFLCFVCSLKTG